MGSNSGQGEGWVTQRHADWDAGTHVVYVMDHDGTEIAVVYGGAIPMETRAEQATAAEANAHLISAAPDLLAACKAALDTVEVLSIAMVPNSIAAGVVSGAMGSLPEQLRAAIAKAGGA